MNIHNQHHQAHMNHAMHHMNHMSHSQSSQRVSRPNPCEIFMLAQFDAAIERDGDLEKKRKRLYYLHEAQERMKVMKKQQGFMKIFLIPFAIIPLFWPFLIFAHLTQKKQEEAMHEQFQFALDYWQIREEEIDQRSKY